MIMAALHTVDDNMYSMIRYQPLRQIKFGSELAAAISFFSDLPM